MIKLVAIAFLIFLLGCRGNGSRQTFSPPDKKEIGEIVKAMIYQDSLKFQRAGDNSNPVPLSADLRKLRVTVPDTTIDVPPPVDHTSISIFNLFDVLVNNQRFFNRVDSSYFLFQNDTLRSLTIDKSISQALVTTTFSEEQQKHNTGLESQYYDLTIPILSADNKKAYIEWTNNCNDCGGATAFYLEKTNDKWTIVGWQRRWMN